jgi:dienelactone hydrolase
VTQADNVRLGRADFPANARYFVERGYAVLIPTRIGYGIAGGPDLEYTGPCAHKTPLEPLMIAAQEMKKVIATAQSQSWADGRRSIVVGDSFGGLIALALAADPPKGLKGVVNVSGGDGGDSVRHVDTPCDPTALEAALKEIGSRSRTPALFLYSANDRFWGQVWPERWFAAWQAAGGQGSFERLPADKNNGHFIFNRNAAAWHGPVEQFLTRLHLP